MAHYIVQRKWVLHTFGGMEFWGVSYKKPYNITQPAWREAPLASRMSFIKAFLLCLWLRSTTDNEYRVADYRKEYVRLYKEIDYITDNFYLDFHFKIKKQVFLSRGEEPCLYEDWFFIFFTYIKRTHYKPINQ